MSGHQLQRSFSQIDNSDVYVSYPPQSGNHSSATAGKAPRVILIFGWMEAKLSHIYKFTEMYDKLYPSATQILIRTYRRSLFAELPVNMSYVFPAVKLLQDSGINAYDSPTSSGLLVHAISNGGAMAQTYLAYCLADTQPKSQPLSLHPALPAQALIYDSLPSTVSLGTFIGFFTSGITSSPARQISRNLLAPPAYAAFKLYRSTIDRGPDSFTLLRAALSNPQLIPQHVPQIYIYSDVDELTPMDSVERYARGVKEGLRSEGVDAENVVRLEKFIGSPHVSHAKMDPGRYWDAIVRTWNKSCVAGGVVRVENGMLRCKL